jgi:hypothetical protein
VALGGKLSEPLLLSLFDASSPGHDGAVLVRGGNIERFAVHLPLSSDHAQLGPGGTRHAAALGLAERCDAFCVVVSEERGTISVGHQGALRVLRGPEELSGKLAAFLREDPDVPSLGRLDRIRSLSREFWREAVLSLLLAFAVWVVFVPGSALTEITQRVAVVVENLPKEFELESVDPPEVQIRLSLRRRDLYLVDEGELHVRVDALLAKLGRRTFDLAPDQIDLPGEARLLEIEPGTVKISLRRKETPPAEPEGRK